MRRAVVLVLALLTFGCGSSPWREVATPHFVLRTDLDADDARHAGLALEETRHALISAAWPKFPFSNNPDTAVYVLSNGIAAPFAPNRPTVSSFRDRLLTKEETAEVHNLFEAIVKARNKKKGSLSAPEQRIARALQLDTFSQ